MKEVHGVIAARAESTVIPDTQCTVRVYDGRGFVGLYIPSDRSPALTADEARFLAKHLVQAAKRLDKTVAK